LLVLLGITYFVKEWWPRHHAPSENWVFTEAELKSFTHLTFGQSAWYLVGQDFYLQDPTAAVHPAFKMDDQLGRQMALLLGHLKIHQELAGDLVQQDVAAFMGGPEDLPALSLTAASADSSWALTLGRQLNYADSFYLKICQTAKISSTSPATSPSCKYVVAADEAPLDTFYLAEEAHRTPVKYQRLRRLFNAAAGTLLNHDLPVAAGAPPVRAAYVYFPVQPGLLGQGPTPWPTDEGKALRYGRYGKLEGTFIQFSPQLPLYELPE